MQNPWLKNLDNNTVILTPNSRLSRFLQRYISQEQTTSVQQTLPILPLQTWLVDCYRQTLLQHSSPLNLLSNNQELQLWQQIIKTSKTGKELLQIVTTAQVVQQAYQTLYAWNLDLKVLENESNSNVQALLEWSRTFSIECQKQQWLSSAHLYSYLIDSFAKQKSLLPKTIYLFSFDELTPQIKQFFTHLKNLNVKIETVEETIANKQYQQITFNDLEEELLTMACWAKKHHAEDPEKMVTCVIPNLTDIRAQVKTVFTKVFFPEAVFNTDFKQEIFNISGGYALNNASIIHTALNILSYQPYTINIDQCTYLLTDPFVADFANESQARAQLDRQLREFNESTPSWKFIQKLLIQSCPNLHKNIEAWQKYYINLPNKQSLSAWKDSFYQLLYYIGWPGNRTLNSTEYQQVSRWYELLHELPHLALAEKNYTYIEALQLLQQLTRNTLFEIESHDGPVQILGILEAAGSVSDCLWVMHLDDKTFPSPANPNPFLPYHLQRQQKMPHSCAERELNFATRLLQRFQQSATDIVFSHHQYNGDQPLSPSPLLKAIPTLNKQDLPLSDYEDITNELIQHTSCEYIQDEQAPVVTTTEKIQGGTGIFKQQAACPFRAFAEYRLQATGLNIPDADFNALERGILLHTCLNKIWQVLKTHENLQQYTENTLRTLIDKIINESITELSSHTTEKLRPRFRLLEQQRLQGLLYKWLQHEKKRPAFTVIAHEQWRQLQIGDLTIHLQIDRIDALTSGEKVIFDYKTGIVNPSSWFGDRPKEPQLLLYTLSEKDIKGISFSQIRIDDMQFKGISADNLHIEGIKTVAQYQNYEIPNTWTALVNEWETILQQLAADFIAGKAKVDPANYNTCDYCELPSLCRIDEKLDL